VTCLGVTRTHLEGALQGRSGPGQVAHLIQGVTQIVVSLGIVRLKLERAVKGCCCFLHQASPPQEQTQLELGRSMGWVEPKDPPKISLSLAIALKPAQNGPPKHEKLRLIGGSPESVRQNLNSVRGFLQPIEQPGELKPAIDMIWLQLEQVTIGPNGIPGRAPVGQLDGLLQASGDGSRVSTGARRWSLGLEQAGRLFRSAGRVGANR
jgi:hypothetical protein